MNKRQRELSDLIRNLYYRAESLCAKHRGRYALCEAVEIASRQERQHRAFGRRLGGTISQRASVETCAQLFALRGFVTPKSARSFDVRADFLTAYSAAEQCEQSCKNSESKDYAAFCRKHRKAILAIDYTDLIGGAP